MYTDDYQGWILNASPFSAAGARFYWRHVLVPYTMNWKGELYNKAGTGFEALVDKMVRLAKGPYYCPSSKPPVTLQSSTAFDSEKNIFTYAMPLTDADDASKAKCPSSPMLMKMEIEILMMTSLQ